MGSSRFPGKPMAQILGQPMISHVYKRAAESKIATTLAVATCDEEIYQYIKSMGGIVVMTSGAHERASDRCAEALIKLENSSGIKYDVVVMIQGDEPMINPNMIAESIAPFSNESGIKVTNLMGKIDSEDEFQDRNCIKVVCDAELNAIYFSREPIPSSYRYKDFPKNKQVCVIAFDREYLIEYTETPPTPLEIIESIDMLRVVENGDKVKMVPTNYKSFSVDTPEDLIRVEKLMGLSEH